MRTNHRLNNNGGDFQIPAEEAAVVNSLQIISLSPPESRILWHLAANVYGTIINLGHGESGGSVSVMGHALKWHGLPYHIHSVDAFKEVIYNRCIRQLKRRELDNVTLHREPTVNAGKRWLAEKAKFGMVFIDASHDYEDVKDDWLIFSQLTNMVAFHDTNQVEVDMVIREFVDWKLIHHVDRIKVYQK